VLTKDAREKKTPETEPDSGQTRRVGEEKDAIHGREAGLRIEFSGDGTINRGTELKNNKETKGKH